MMTCVCVCDDVIVVCNCIAFVCALDCKKKIWYGAVEISIVIIIITREGWRTPGLRVVFEHRSCL